MSKTLWGAVVGGLVGGPILWFVEVLALSHVTFDGGPLTLSVEGVVVMYALPFVLGGIVGAVIGTAFGAGTKWEDGCLYRSPHDKMTCRKCGRQVPVGYRTCKYCGGDLK